MDAHGLGPNGAMLYCLEYLEANVEWLEGELERAMRGLEEEGDTFQGEDDEVDEVSGGKRERRKWKRDEVYVVFDTPGQVELSTNHGSLKRIIEALQKRMGFRVRSLSLSLPFSPAYASMRAQLAAVHLMDSTHILDASKYVSVLLLALRTMLQLELPHINVLSKIDLLGQTGDLRESGRFGVLTCSASLCAEELIEYLTGSCSLQPRLLH